MSAGYAAVGLDGPKFATMDRKAALISIRQFLDKAGPKVSQAASRLQPLLAQGLRDLDRRLIPANWIE